MMRKLIHFNLHVMAAAVLVAGFAAADQPAPAAPRALTVSAATAAGNDEKSDKVADYFVQRIGLGRNYQAKQVAGCSWDEAPKGVAAENHVNIVQLKFGVRQELLAIMPEPASGGVVVAARAPALFQPPIPHAYAAPSGDYQFPENAPNDLVANFAYALEHRAEPRGIYQLILQDWKQEAGGGAAPEGVSSTKDVGMIRIYPLAAAALYAEGYRACTKPQESAITLSFRMEETECAVQAVLAAGGRNIYELERQGIKYEKLYDSLRALFLNLLEWRGTVADFFNPGRDRFQPLAVIEVENAGASLEARKAVLVGTDKSGFAAYEPATGIRPWEITFAERQTGFGRKDQMFFSGNQITRVSAATGKNEYSMAVENQDCVDVWGNYCADGAGRQLRLFEKGQGVWSNTLPWSIEAGPLLTEDGVVVGDAKGDLRAFSLKGQELWKVSLPRTACGEMYSDGGLYFANDDRGGMVAVDRQGKLLWQAEIGDVMTGPPQVTEAGVVVGSKAGKLFLLDKSTGKVLKQCPFKSWLMGCRVVGSKIVCLTYDKRLHVIDPARFEVEKSLRFPFQFRPDILPVKDFPHRRSQGEMKTTGGLVSDVKGNVYVIPAAAGP